MTHTALSRCATSPSHHYAAHARTTATKHHRPDALPRGLMPAIHRRVSPTAMHCYNIHDAHPQRRRGPFAGGAAARQSSMHTARRDTPSLPCRGPLPRGPPLAKAPYASPATTHCKWGHRQPEPCATYVGTPPTTLPRQGSATTTAPPNGSQDGAFGE